MESLHPYGVRTHVECVLLRKVFHQRTARSHCRRVGVVYELRFQRVLVLTVYVDYVALSVPLTALLVVENVVAGYHAVVHLVHHLHVAVSLAVARLVVVAQVVAHNVAFLGRDGRAPVEFHVVGAAVVVAVSGVDDFSLVGFYHRWTSHVGFLGLRVVEQVIGCYAVLRRRHHHIVEKVCLVLRKIVLASARHNLVLPVDQRSAVAPEVVGIVGIAVVVEAVAVERPAGLGEHNVLPRLNHPAKAVVVCPVAGDGYASALAHLHVAEGTKRVLLLVEVGAVAVKARVLIAELHTASDHLHTRHLHLIVLKLVGMVEINLLVGSGLIHIIAKTIFGSRSGLAHQFGLSVTIVVVYLELSVVGAGADVDAQIYTPEFSAVKLVAVDIDVVGLVALGIIFRVAWIPFYE